MDEDYNKCKKILKTYGQEHLMDFYEELNTSEKKSLLHQILSIDFSEILNLYQNSMKDEPFDINSITNQPYIDKSTISNKMATHYKSKGSLSIKNGELAVVTMAGGQGSRLGYKGPKGTFMLDISPKKSLFEILIDNLKYIQKFYGVTIPWYIMTSDENDNNTKAFFEENNFFGYPSDYIVFFKQEKLPLIDVSGKLMLDRLDLIKQASNGNGNVFAALLKNGIIDNLECNKIKWVSFGGIDNVLSKPVDPLFLGIAIDKNYKVCSKSIFKEDATSNIAVFCKKYNKPAILDYNNISEELSNKTDENGNFFYRDINIVSHLISIDALKEICNLKLPYHRAYKKNSFINYEGTKEVPSSPNSFKFETFIFDAFSHFNDMLLLRVKKEDEFAPIKDFTSQYNPEIAKDMYEDYQKRNGYKFFV